MTYEEFQGSVIDRLEKRFPKETSLHVRKIIKTNDRELDGLIISEPQMQVTPTIYLNPYYELLNNKTLSMDEIIDRMFTTYLEHRKEEIFDTDSFTEFDRAKESIVLKLIGKKQNEKLLYDVPYFPYLDLAIVFSFIVNIEGEGTGSILVHDCHLKEWGKTKEELYEIARENTPRLLPPVLTPFKEVIRSISSIPLDKELEKLPLFVLSNALKTFGATCILYEGLLKSLSKKIDEDDYYIIPSCIHETLLLPQSFVADEKDLDCMVREINRTRVAPDAVLSDHAYIYDAKTDSISM